MAEERKVIPFSKVSIGIEELEAVQRVLASGWLAAGPETEAFEREFADYVGAKYAIFTNSCTSALKMAYKWAKEQGCGIAVYPQNTFCATYSAAVEMGLSAYAREFDKQEDYLLDPSCCPVNVHYGGIKDTMPSIIEDSAHRIEPNDPLVGKIRCYSFYATKNMTTGSGGMFVTNDKEIYERARLYWKDGLTTSTADRARGAVGYEIKAMAGGYDGNDIAAAIGRVQLKKLPEFTKRRNAIRDRYNAAFGQTWLGNHLYPYFVAQEDQVGSLIAHLKEHGIQSSYHYPGTGWLGVSLPIYPDLTEEEQEYIIKTVRKWKPEWKK